MTTDEKWNLSLITKLSEEDKQDRYLILLKELQPRYPEIYNKVKKYVYHEDKDKVFDYIFLSILDTTKSIRNFRMARSDNNHDMKVYGRAKMSGKASRFDSSVYSTKTKIVYYYGFDY
jgi:hypothetical protein